MIYGAALFLLLILGMPVGITLFVVGLSYLHFATEMPLLVAAQRVATGIDSSALLAIPFFLLAAELMNQTGITDRIFRMAKACIGRVPGGLGHVNVLASLLFASMSGSGVADAAGLGRIEVRAMVRDGYDRAFSAAVTAASTTIAPIIPPSISLVVFGVASGASIGGLFLGGVVPGILMAISLMVLVAIYAARRGYGKSERFDPSELATATKEALLPMLTPVIVVGGIWGGFFTPTEAGAFAVFYALFLGVVVYRSVSLRALPEVVFSAILSASNVLFIIAASALIGWILTLEQVPLHLAAAIVEVAPEPWMFLLLLNVLLLVLGCFMASAPVIIMLVPVLLPVAGIMDVHPIHLGVVMVLNLMIGLITPPVGVCLFAVSEVAEISPTALIRALLPFFVPLLVVLLLITFIPELVLFLPRMFGFL